MKRVFIFMSWLFSLGLIVCGCGGGPATTTPISAVSVAVVPLSATTIVHAQSIELNATVANDTSNAGVSWTVSGTGCAGDACGTLSYIEPFHAHYTAPESPTSQLTVNVAARSIKDPTKSASVELSVWPHLAITTVSLPSGVQGSAYSVVSENSGGLLPLRWSLALGSLPQGLTLNPENGVISGTPAITGVANFTIQVKDTANPPQVAEQPLEITVKEPGLTIVTQALSSATKDSPYSHIIEASGGTQPYLWDLSAGNLPDGLILTSSGGSAEIKGTPSAAGPFNFTVIVVDSSVPQQQTIQTFSIWVGEGPGSFDGPYAFVLSGYTASGYTTAVGSFVADKVGNITSGRIDVNEAGSYWSDTLTGSYSEDPNQDRGTMTIDTRHGSRTFAFVTNGEIAGATTNGRMIESDSHGWISGTFRAQNKDAFSTAALHGDFAFGMAGNNSSGGRFVEVGAVNLDGNGQITAGNMDYNNAGAVGSATLTGSYSIAADGRGTMTILSSGEETRHLVFYVTDVNDAFFISVDGPPLSNYAGRVMQQQGPFSSATLNGIAVNIGLGVCPSNPNGSKAMAGLLSFNGMGEVNVSYDENVCGVVGNRSKTDTFAVDAQGRVMIGEGSAYLYLVSDREGFYIGTSQSAEFGWMEPQSAGPFDKSSLSIFNANTYGVLPPVRPEGIAEVGERLFLDGVATVFVDDNVQGVSSTHNFNQTYSVSANGRVTTDTGNTTWYIVSPSRVFIINTQPGETDPLAAIGSQAHTNFSLWPGWPWDIGIPWMGPLF